MVEMARRESYAIETVALTYCEGAVHRPASSAAPSGGLLRSMRQLRPLGRVVGAPEGHRGLQAFIREDLPAVPYDTLDASSVSDRWVTAIVSRMSAGVYHNDFNVLAPMYPQTGLAVRLCSGYTCSCPN